MSQPNDSAPEPRYEDSRLREFLRRATPILAAERGWNERSQLKIKALSEDLKLPEKLYQIGIVRLREGKLRYEDRFTVYERAFLEKLENDFRKTGTTVFTAAQEKHVLQVAATEYQIPEPRARELVREVAEQRGVRRVSRLDAIDYLGKLIDEQMGQGTELSAAAQSNLKTAAKKWGVDEEQLAELVISSKQKRHAQDRSQNPWRMRTLMGLASALLILGGWWAIRTWPIDKTLVVEAEEKAADSFAETSETNAAPKTPAWWSLQTKEQVDDFNADHRASRFPMQWLRSESESERLRGYAEILELSGSSDPDFSVRCSLLYANFFQDETLPVSQAMAEMMQQVAEMSESQLPSNLRGFSRGWQIINVLLKCHELPITKEKANLLSSVALQLTGTESENPEFTDRFKQAYADLQWRFLKTASHSNPELAAGLLDGLGDLTRQHLKSASPLEYSTAVNVMAMVPEAWPKMKQTLERMVATSTEDQMRFLYLTKQQSSDQDFQTWLGVRLANQLGINTSSLTPQRIDKALEQRLGLSSTISSNGISTPWQRIQEDQDLRSLLKNATPATASTIANAVHYGTISFLLSEGENRNDPTLTARAERLYNEGAPNLLTRRRTIDNNLPNYRSIQRRALPSDIRALENALKKLQTPSENTDQINATAFERLARAAPRIRDLPWTSAIEVARFLLEANGTSELVEIEKNLSLLQHWPNLALALADQIQTTDGDLDQAMTCVSLLLDFQPQLTGDNWRRQLSEQVQRQVALGLRNTAELQGNDSRFQWNELRSLLVEHYRIRCAVSGIAGAAYSSTNSPAKLASLWALGQTKNSNSMTAQNSMEQRIESNRYLRENEMQLFALQACLAINSFVANPSNSAAQPNNTRDAILANELLFLRAQLGDNF